MFSLCIFQCHPVEGSLSQIAGICLFQEGISDATHAKSYVSQLPQGYRVFVSLPPY